MATTSELRRAYKGPLVFSHGFRAFFLGAGIWATLAMVLWVGTLAAGLELPSRYVGGYWHQHEMLFGYTTAVIAGFLLTAVPNWTGRLPVVGDQVECCGLRAIVRAIKDRHVDQVYLHRIVDSGEMPHGNDGLGNATD